jgi:hypothetical protein
MYKVAANLSFNKRQEKDRWICASAWLFFSVCVAREGGPEVRRGYLKLKITDKVGDPLP